MRNKTAWITAGLAAAIALGCGSGGNGQGSASPDASAEEPDPVLRDDGVLKIDHYKRPCVGEGAQFCFRAKPEGEDAYRPMYSAIEGFEFEWGRRYELEVAVHEVDDPPAGGSSREYELVDVRAEERVAPGTSFELEFPFIGEGYTPFLDIDEDAAAGELLSGRGFRCADEALCEDAQARLDEGDDFVATFAYDDDIDDALILSEASTSPPEACALEKDLPCTGEDCCPQGCEAHEGDAYDMDAACELGTAVYGCTEPSPDIDDAPAWYCSADGDVAAYAAYQPSGVTDDERVLRCTDLDEYDEDPTEAEEFPACD